MRASRAIEYEDLNYPTRAGWKEIIIVPHDDIRIISATAKAEDRSRALEFYPTDATVAPPQDTKHSSSGSRYHRMQLASRKGDPAVIADSAAARPLRASTARVRAC